MGFLTVLNRPARIPKVVAPAPVFRASSFTTHSGTGAGNITIPAAVHVGDLMVIAGLSQTTVSPTPSGWTAGPTATGGSTFVTKSCSFYRIATAGDTGGATTVAVGSSALNSFCFVAYSGATQLNTSGGTGNANITDTTWGPSASVTTTVGNCVVIEAWGALSNSSNPLGASPTLPATSRGSEHGTGFVASALSDQVQVTSGPASTQSISGANASGWSVVTLAISA